MLNVLAGTVAHSLMCKLKIKNKKKAALCVPKKAFKSFSFSFKFSHYSLRTESAQTGGG